MSNVLNPEGIDITLDRMIISQIQLLVERYLIHRLRWIIHRLRTNEIQAADLTVACISPILIDFLGSQFYLSSTFKFLESSIFRYSRGVILYFSLKTLLNVR